VSNAPEIEAFGRHLATLDDEQREQALAQAKILGVSNADSSLIGEPPVRTLADYLAEKIPEPPALVKATVGDETSGTVVRGAITALTAPGGKGKTVLSMNRFLRWGAGLPLFEGLDNNQIPTHPLKTLLIENEGAAGFFQARMQRLLDGLDYDRDELAAVNENVLIWGDGGWSSMKLDDPNNMELVRRAAEKFQPDIIFFEPFRGLHTANENDNSEMAVVLDAMNGLASTYDCGVMLTHHERKSGVQDGEDPMWAARGAAVLTDLAGVVERFKTAKNGTLREVSWTKSRFGPVPAPVRMRFEAASWRYFYVPQDDDETEILEELESIPDEWFTVASIAELTAETEDHVRKRLNALAKDGRVSKTKNRNPNEGGFLYRSKTGNPGRGAGMELD
jgi:hypothetical protein